MDEETCVYEITRPTSLERLLTLEQTTDIALVGADGKNPVKAHKAVLASASEFFMRMFFGEAREGWKENAKGVVRLEEFSSDVVRWIVDIVYTGRVEVSPSHGYKTSLELLRASDFFHIPQLEEACDYFLRRYGRDIVQKEFESFSAPLLCKILASDALGCEEIAIFKAVEQWIEAHKTSLREDDIKEILGMVRYGLIPAKELISVVGPSRWKDEALFLAALDNWVEPNVCKIKVPQHLARANTFPLLPFTPGECSITVNDDGVYSYHVRPSPQPQHTQNVQFVSPEQPNIGVLLAVDNLEAPIKASSKGQSLSFSFSVLPANEQAIVFSRTYCQPQTHDHTAAFPTTGLFQPVSVLHTQPLGQLQGLGGGLFARGSYSTIQESPNELCISKTGDAVMIAESGSERRTMKFDISSTAKHVLIGMQVNGSATLKQVPNS